MSNRQSPTKINIVWEDIKSTFNNISDNDNQISLIEAETSQVNNYTPYYFKIPYIYTSSWKYFPTESLGAFDVKFISYDITFDELPEEFINHVDYDIVLSNQKSILTSFPYFAPLFVTKNVEEIDVAGSDMKRVTFSVFTTLASFGTHPAYNVRLQLSIFNPSYYV